MRRLAIAVLAASTVAAVAASAAPVAASSSVPLWVKHVRNYPGGISNGVRSYLDPGVQAAQHGGIVAAPSGKGDLPNVQMNDDSDPPVPQNETAVAYSLDDPLVAVAASNDYVSGGVAVMRTSDGGRALEDHADHAAVPRHRRLLHRRRPGRCVQPPRPRVLSVAALLLPRAAVLGGPGLRLDRQRARRGRRDVRRRSPRRTSTTRTARSTTHVFNDKEYIAVDNNPHSSPHYGRLYVTYTSSTSSPTGSATTARSSSPTRTPSRFNPNLTVFQPRQGRRRTTPAATGPGRRPTSSPCRWSSRTAPSTSRYVVEECNTSLDHALPLPAVHERWEHVPAERRRRSTSRASGWTTLTRPTSCPTTKFRTPNTVALA